MISEKVQVATTIRPKVAMLTSGMDRSVVAMKRGNARGARGAGHPLYDPFIVANRQRDEPLGCSGGRQPSSGGTSRMTGDRLVRICEGSRGKFLRSTRHRLSDSCPCVLSLRYPARYEGRRRTSPKGGNRGNVLTRVSGGDGNRTHGSSLPANVKPWVRCQLEHVARA